MNRKNKKWQINKMQISLFISANFKEHQKRTQRERDRPIKHNRFKISYILTKYTFKLFTVISIFFAVFEGKNKVIAHSFVSNIKMLNF